MRPLNELNTGTKEIDYRRNFIEDLENKYRNLIEVNHSLSREIVSFQANKKTPFFRWFKYKEGFSELIVSYLLNNLTSKPGHLLDPFAGTGSALFAARDRGWRTTGIELLPVGVFAINARLAREKVNIRLLSDTINEIKTGVWKNFDSTEPAFEHISITVGAFPKKTEVQLHRYLEYCKCKINNLNLRNLLTFAAFSILESISYTRKDGQYLRWDIPYKQRIGEEPVSAASEPESFETALYRQLEIMREDLFNSSLDLFNETSNIISDRDKHDINLYEDTCLTRLRKLNSRQFNFILTSPPYCNRYDYTRTYALELVFLGINENKVKKLRQALLSCTVENKEKVNYLCDFYKSNHALSLFNHAINAFDNQSALQEILKILELMKEQKKLNNPGIVRMIRNYFLEMSLVIRECSRIMKPGAYFVMVNDNVSYNGEQIPVDLILSEFAVASGLIVKNIWTLGKGKGNSSQQMGRHGRKEQRKCVYVWQKPK